MDHPLVVEVSGNRFTFMYSFVKLNLSLVVLILVIRCADLNTSTTLLVFLTFLNLI